MRRSTSVELAGLRGSTSAISSRSELVPQSMAATRTAPGSVFMRGASPARGLAPRRPVGIRATHGPPPPRPGGPRASRPSGLAPGTASSCATSACRHLTRSGMPPALGVPAGAARRPRPGRLVPPGQVVAVGRQVGLRAARARQPAAAPSPASARRPRAGSPRRPRAGRSGSRGWGTGCRRAAAGPSPRRQAGRTGSGARPRSSPRGSRPSCSATAAASGRDGTAGPGHLAGALSACCTDSTAARTRARPGRVAAAVFAWAAAAVDDHVAGLARQAHVQLVLRLLLHVGVAAAAACCSLLRAAELGRDRLPLGLQLVDLPALGDVLAHRVGQAQRDRAEHHGQHRSPAGQPGPVRLRRARAGPV